MHLHQSWGDFYLHKQATLSTQPHSFTTDRPVSVSKQFPSLIFFRNSIWNVQSHFTAKQFLRFSFIQWLSSIKPLWECFPLWYSGYFHNTHTSRETLCFISRQFISGTDNQPVAFGTASNFYLRATVSNGLHQARADVEAAGKHKFLVVKQRHEGPLQSAILVRPGTQRYAQSNPIPK